MKLLDSESRPLNLSDRAEAVALELRRQFHRAVFTSGRRAVKDQARAMAENVVLLGRDWISKTYKFRPIASALQGWVDKHPEAISRGAIVEGLESVLSEFEPDDLLRLSKHFSGDAFDLRIVGGFQGRAMVAWLRSRSDVAFLDHEGGKPRWHAMVVEPEPSTNQPNAADAARRE